MRLALRALVLAGLLTLATSGAPASAQVSAMATFTRTEVGLGKFDYHVTLFNISSLAEADIVRARFALSDPVSLSNLHAPPRWGRTAATYASEPGTTFAEYWSFSAAAPPGDPDPPPPPRELDRQASVPPGASLSGFRFRADRAFDAFTFETFHRDPSNPSNLLMASGQARLVPEPASLVLLFAGGVPLVLRRRRRRASISVRRPVCATPERSKADARQRWLHDTGPGGRRPGIVGP